MYRIRDVIDMAIKGIPEKYRAEMWMIYSGKSFELMYRDYLAMSKCAVHVQYKKDQRNHLVKIFFVKLQPLYMMMFVHVMIIT